MAVLAAGTTIGGIDVIAELQRIAAGGVASGGSTASSPQADLAIKLKTARTLKVDLASTTPATFDGSTNATLGVSGILPVANGGTGNANGTVTRLATPRTITVSLAKAGGAAFDGSGNIELGVAGILPVANGGTGNNAGTVAKLTTPRTLTVNLAKSGGVNFDGSGNVEIGITGVLPAANGGTGGTSGAGSSISPATATPNAPGTAAVGTSAKYAREDHVHPLQTSVTGNAGTATKFATARLLNVNLNLVGQQSFDGSKNIEIPIQGILTRAYGGTGNADGRAASAEKLYTTVEFLVNLGSSDAATFNGTAACVPGVGGVLPTSKGGTGLSSLVNDNYTSYQMRGIAVTNAAQSSVPNGCVCLVYS